MNTRMIRLSCPILILIFLGPVLTPCCNRDTSWKGQPPIKRVSTLTVPIQLQYKGVFDLGNGIHLSNDFDGARLNGAARTNDTLITLLITPENTPINMSPWYAFKLWSTVKGETYLRFTYPENAAHRYWPKLSHNGRNWEPLDSSRYRESEKIIVEDMEVPREATIRVPSGPDTLWIAAQEVITFKDTESWIGSLEPLGFVKRDTIGLSREGRPLYLLKIGEGDDRKMIFVMSRQHPPEVTGYLAMQAFVETICSDTGVAEQFRREFNTYVVPMANPDGVHHGHWRHNSGGVDLNRDWSDFNQPETSAIRDFMKRKAASSGGKFYFGVDFHSTWEDIYYTISPRFEGNMPGLVPDMIHATAEELPGYTPNIRPRSDIDSAVSSNEYFFNEFGAESLTYEIGDRTPRAFIRKKGAISALKLMGLMLDRTD